MRIQMVIRQLKREREHIAERIGQIEEALGSLRMLSGVRRRLPRARLSGRQRMAIRRRNRSVNRVSSSIHWTKRPENRAKMKRWQKAMLKARGL